MTISTPALEAIRQQLAVEQLALRDEQLALDEASAAYGAAAEAYNQRRDTVAALEASLEQLGASAEPAPQEPADAEPIADPWTAPEAVEQ